jgi:hypothetical protein
MAQHRQKVMRFSRDPLYITSPGRITMFSYYYSNHFNGLTRDNKLDNRYNNTSVKSTMPSLLIFRIGVFDTH